MTDENGFSESFCLNAKAIAYTRNENDSIKGLAEYTWNGNASAGCSCFEIFYQGSMTAHQIAYSVASWLCETSRRLTQVDEIRDLSSADNERFTLRLIAKSSEPVYD